MSINFHFPNLQKKPQPKLRAYLPIQKPNAKSIFIDQKGSYVVTILCDGAVWCRVVMVE